MPIPTKRSKKKDVERGQTSVWFILLFSVRTKSPDPGNRDIKLQ